MEFRGMKIAPGLEIWQDDQREGIWRILGSAGWNGNAAGDAGQMTRLALAILENIPDDRWGLPPVDPEQEHGALTYITEAQEAPPGEEARVGGTMIALGAWMLRDAHRRAWEKGILADPVLAVSFRGEQVELPFRMEVLEHETE